MPEPIQPPAATNQPPATPPAANPPAAPPAPTGDTPGQPSGNGDSGTSKVVLTAEQQAHVDRIIQERLERAKTKWDTDAAEAQRQATETAEQQRLQDQQQWQQLAQKHEAKVNELKPRAKAADEYEAALKVYLERERAGRDAGTLELLDNLPPHKQLEWLAAHPAAAPTAPPPAPETDASKGGKRPNGKLTDAEEARLKAKYGIP